MIVTRRCMHALHAGIKYDEDERRESCTLDDDDPCCFKDFGYTKEEFCEKDSTGTREHKGVLEVFLKITF